MSVIPRSDRDFLTRIAMPRLGVPRVRLATSESRKIWPDVWVRKGKVPTVTVTREWARQNASERRKRLVHELLHARGLGHGRYGNLVYSTIPSKDSYSRAVYQLLLRNPNPNVEAIRERFRDPLAAVTSQLTTLFPGKVTSRLKTTASIEEKLVRRELPLTVLTDIAGARVVFPTLDSLYAGLQQIRRGFRVVEEQDYISQPKPGGYRSYHLLVISHGLPVEVQLKTPRMLEWAEVGHVPFYKGREELHQRFGKGAKKLEKYHRRMAEHYYWSDIGLHLRRPKAPRLWRMAGFPLLSLNPVCPECGTPNSIMRPRVRCARCGRYLVVRRRV